MGNEFFVSGKTDCMNQHPGWAVVAVGLIIAALGLAWVFLPRIPGFGRLPGDIAIERDNFRFYFPVVTCIAVSLLLTALTWIVRYFSR